jgi:hypothetical protein
MMGSRRTTFRSLQLPFHILATQIEARTHTSFYEIRNITVTVTTYGQALNSWLEVESCVISLNR